MSGATRTCGNRLSWGSLPGQTCAPLRLAGRRGSSPTVAPAGIAVSESTPPSRIRPLERPDGKRRLRITGGAGLVLIVHLAWPLVHLPGIAGGGRIGAEAST